ncbi:MAG: type IV toxin-antitoxin system AbiEi family antitoxin domain-containing protein [Pseudomonadota bacterium]
MGPKVRENIRLLSGRKAFHTESGLPTHLPGSFTDYQPPSGAFTLQVSTPERAVLEWIAISTNPLLFSSDMVDTFSGLNTLRPRRLQALLEGCRSVRTKRAFMVLDRHAGHAWYRRLDRTRLDLGKGKRQLWPGGKLDKEYLVTPSRRGSLMTIDTRSAAFWHSIPRSPR